MSWSWIDKFNGTVVSFDTLIYILSFHLLFSQYYFSLSLHGQFVTFVFTTRVCKTLKWNCVDNGATKVSCATTLTRKINSPQQHNRHLHFGTFCRIRIVFTFVYLISKPIQGSTITKYVCRLCFEKMVLVFHGKLQIRLAVLPVLRLLFRFAYC